MSLSKTLTTWDPILSADWKQQTPSKQCIARIQRDIASLFKEPPQGIFIVPDDIDMTLVFGASVKAWESSITEVKQNCAQTKLDDDGDLQPLKHIIHALIIGPFDTPYEGGYFYFLLRCPPDYPIRSPRVKLMTTGQGRVRFNPNLYASGKVCLSILGTWEGPCWSPAQTLSSVLISIQSLMCENPYFNEPGFETKERHPGDSVRYNEIIKHETLRVAVCDMLEGETCDSRNCPQSLKSVMEKSFPEFYEYYERTVKANLHMTKQAMLDPYSTKRGIFDYYTIDKRLQAIKAKLEAKGIRVPGSSSKC